VINTSPEPVTNVAASLTEDVVAVSSVLLAAFYPVIIIIVVAVGLLISFIVLPKTIRYFRAIIGKLRGKPKTAS
jgi:Ca2+/Na+ antiporter